VIEIQREESPAPGATSTHSRYAAGVLSLAAFVLVAAFCLHRGVMGYPRPPARFDHIGRGDVAFLQAAASTFFPARGAIALAGEDADLPAWADRHLASLPSRQRLLMRALFLLFEHSTLLWPARGIGGFRRFSSLTPEQRRAFIDGWAGSRFYLRRTGFTALKAVLVLGYFGHPDCLQALGLAPFEIEPPICEADTLYPPIGKGPDAIAYRTADITPPSDGTPLWSGASGATAADESGERGDAS